jgi:ABC-2 type transport system ATP-binding protein
MDDIAISIKGLEKSYGSFQALFGVDLEVKRGEILGFLGPNGAGKTTTIRCILDQIRPQKGSIHVFGVNPQVHPTKVHELTGYLPGELHLDDNFRVDQQLHYFSQLRGGQTEWFYVERLAERLNLDLTRKIKNLSSGNKQKVGVIQALMHKPALLLLDEPTAGLDPLMQQEVYRLLREVQRDGTTVFFSSHIISEVEFLAELSLRRIKIRFLDPIDPDNFQAIPGVKLLSSSNGLEVDLEVEGDMDRLIKFLSDYRIKDLVTNTRSLEDVFLKYYQTDPVKN